MRSASFKQDLVSSEQKSLCFVKHCQCSERESLYTCTKISHGLRITILKSTSVGVTMSQMIFDASHKDVPATVFQRFLWWEVFQHCVNVFCIFNFSCKYSCIMGQSDKMDLYCILNRWARPCSRLQLHESLYTHVKWKSDAKKKVPGCGSMLQASFLFSHLTAVLENKASANKCKFSMRSSLHVSPEATGSFQYGMPSEGISTECGSTQEYYHYKIRSAELKAGKVMDFHSYRNLLFLICNIQTCMLSNLKNTLKNALLIVQHYLGVGLCWGRSCTNQTQVTT